MKYLPFEDFEIQTNLSSDEIFYRLHAAVDTQRKWWIFTNKPFWGEVSRQYFKIWRTDTWRRDNPVVIGTVVSEGLKCRVLVKMRLPWFSLLTSLLFFGFIWLAFFITPAEWLIQKIQTGSWQVESPEGYLIAIAILTIFHLVAASIFRNDVRRVKDHLLRISQTNEENIIYKNQIWGMTEIQIVKITFVVLFVVSVGWIAFNLLQ